MDAEIAVAQDANHSHTKKPVQNRDWLYAFVFAICLKVIYIMRGLIEYLGVIIP